jgi:hypothetical protein
MLSSVRGGLYEFLLFRAVPAVPLMFYRPRLV